MKVKAKHYQTLEVEIDKETAYDVARVYLLENPEMIINIAKVIFLKKYEISARAVYDPAGGVWEVYENYGSHYSGYEKVENQPPKEETEAFQEIVARLYALFGTSLS